MCELHHRPSFTCSAIIIVMCRLAKYRSAASIALCVCSVIWNKMKTLCVLVFWEAVLIQFASQKGVLTATTATGMASLIKSRRCWLFFHDVAKIQMLCDLFVMIHHPYVMHILWRYVFSGWGGAHHGCFLETRKVTQSGKTWECLCNCLCVRKSNFWPVMWRRKSSEHSLNSPKDTTAIIQVVSPTGTQLFSIKQKLVQPFYWFRKKQIREEKNLYLMYGWNVTICSYS